MKPADPRGSPPRPAPLQERQHVVLPPETENECVRRLEAVILDVRARLMAAELRRSTPGALIVAIAKAPEPAASWPASENAASSAVASTSKGKPSIERGHGLGSASRSFAPS